MRKTLIIVGIMLALGIAGLFLLVTRPVNTTETPTDDIAHIEIGMNTPLVWNNVMISVARVIEDSRCPSDVQCIQAGTVRAIIDTDTAAGTSTIEMVLGETRTVGDFTFSLDGVKPYPVSTKTISPADYKFTFGLI